MPLTYGDAEADEVGAWGHDVGGCDFLFVVVVDPLHLATEHYHGLGGVVVAVDGHHRAGLQGIQHALALVGGGVAQVEVHPQPRRSLSLSGQGVEEFLINQHLKCRVES